jgi:hypothetical protein
MLQMSLVGKVLLQVLGVGGYFAVVVALYWRGLWNAGAVAIVVGLLFFFTTVVSSGGISIAHLFPWDPNAVARLPSVELLMTVSFLCMGLGLAADLRIAAELYLVPDSIASVAILLTLMFVFISGAACCFIRFLTAVKYWGRP